MLVKHFTSIRQSAPSGLYFCQKTLGLSLCSARAKLGSRPVGTALQEIGCSTRSAALQRHSVHPQNPPSVRATLGTGRWLPKGLCSWKALGMWAEMLLFRAAVGRIPLDITNSSHLKQGTEISLIRTLLIIRVLVRKWENDTSNRRDCFCSPPALPVSSAMHAVLSLLSFQSGSREATWRKEGGGRKLTFKIAANSSSVKCVWRYKRYSWQLTLLYWNNESRVVQAAT